MSAFVSILPDGRLEITCPCCSGTFRTAEPEWTELELAVLDLLYPDFDAGYIATRLTNRSIEQIRAMAKARGFESGRPEDS